MNTGIQDAWNPGWKLALVARGQANQALLDSYDAERRPVGHMVVRFTDRASSLATSTNPLVSVLRIRLVPRMLPPGAAVRPGRGVRLPHGLPARNRLPAQPSGAGRPPQTTPRPTGRRAPTRRAHHPRRRGVLAGPGAGRAPLPPAALWPPRRLGRQPAQRPAQSSLWHGGRRAPDPRGCARRPAGRRRHALARLGVKQTAHYLIRPDGHIAFRAASTDLQGLQRHLAHWLPNATPHPA
jgi:hypothetical protein